MDESLEPPAFALGIFADIVNIRSLTPKILLQIEGPYAAHKHIKAGKAFLLYHITLSVVRKWPDTPLNTLTHIRYLVEAPEVVSVLVYCTHDSISSTTADDYFESLGRMASGTHKLRNEISIYALKLSQRLISILIPNIITIPRAYAVNSVVQIPHADWSSGCPRENWILLRMRAFLQDNVQTQLPTLSLDMAKLTVNISDTKILALGAIGDRALEYLFELLWLSMDTPIGLDVTIIRNIVLSNKMFSILGPVLGINWQNPLLPVYAPLPGTVIKLVADMFKVHIGAIVTRPCGPSALENWWFRNMPNIIKQVMRLLEIFKNQYQGQGVIGKRQRSDDSDEDEDGRKRMRPYENKLSLKSPRAVGKENRGLLRGG